MTSRPNFKMELPTYRRPSLSWVGRYPILFLAALVSVHPLAPIFHHEMGMSGGAVPKKSRLRRTEGDCRAVLKNFGACGGRFQGR